MQTKTASYFAAGNTTKGFKTYFPEIFNPNKLEKIYILKGGPGTGKSGLMRSVLETAEKNKMKAEAFLCASDPSSLDGILLPEKKIAILDGTSPHTTDPDYPGVVETILNTGAFWDREKLFPFKEEIMSLVQEKKRSFKRAYQFLRAYGEIEEEIKKIGNESMMVEKMDRAAERILDKTVKKEVSPPWEETRNLSTFCATGKPYLNSFTSLCESVFIVEDHLHTAYQFLDRIYHGGNIRGASMIISHSPVFVDEIDGILFPESKTAFVIGERNYDLEEKGKVYHYVNMERFLLKDTIRNHKQKIKFGKKCTDMLLSGAVDAFRRAAQFHFQLERYYVGAMDFSAMENQIKELKKEIFK